jgi:hypothetical protein
MAWAIMPRLQFKKWLLTCRLVSSVLKQAILWPPDWDTRDINYHGPSSIERIVNQQKQNKTLALKKSAWPLFWRYDISSTGHFTNQPLGQSVVTSIGHFHASTLSFHLWIILTTNHFNIHSFHRIVISSITWFHGWVILKMSQFIDESSWQIVISATSHFNS